MVADRLTDGVRIGQLFASEVTGDRGRLRDLDVADADPDVEPTADGALAFRLVDVSGGDNAGETGDSDVVADVYVQPDRVRIEFRRAPERVADAAGEAGLRVRPKAVRPPRTLVFVEDGAEIKRVLPVLERVVGDEPGNA
ncbi:hypothetical protein DQW50_10780 [Halorubrum sp. 48-1-W]|uniref:hypothetical protein n=1 Tax=Halorubrum sp. 48-1-W TaxID=2249761 RepID=UPI000DCD0ECA|nr:hypothetical protein [Halorubrum sp. 48-1-W]RAW45119.1 hypothetical protein DQW50_10780 [Halorubrum sp. 48-1-W]